MNGNPGEKNIKMTDCPFCKSKADDGFPCSYCNDTGKITYLILNGCGNCHYNVGSTCHRHSPIFVNDGSCKERKWPMVSNKYHRNSSFSQDSDWCGDWEIETHLEVTG